jgi:hypothetical protein
MKISQIRLLQQSLITEGFRPGPVDGALGDKTYAALEKALKKTLGQLACRPLGVEAWAELLPRIERHAVPVFNAREKGNYVWIQHLFFLEFKP